MRAHSPERSRRRGACREVRDPDRMDRGEELSECPKSHARRERRQYTSVRIAATSAGTPPARRTRVTRL